MEILVEISKARCLQMVVPGLYLNSDVLNYDKLPWTIPALVLITVNILHPKHWKSVKGQSKLKFSMEVAKWKISFPPFESDGSILKSLFFFSQFTIVLKMLWHLMTWTVVFLFKVNNKAIFWCYNKDQTQLMLWACVQFLPPHLQHFIWKWLRCSLFWPLWFCRHRTIYFIVS